MLNGIQPTVEWETCYWIYNCPLQMWKEDDGWRVLNYMPRKECCEAMDELVTPEELPQFCRNASIVLRNLAALFDAMAEGKVDTIYYPDETVEDAIEQTAENRLEATLVEPKQ